MKVAALLLFSATADALSVVSPARPAAAFVPPSPSSLVATQTRAGRPRTAARRLRLDAKKRSAAEEMLKELVNGTGDEDEPEEEVEAVANGDSEAVVAEAAAAVDGAAEEEEPSLSEEEETEESIRDREMMRQAILMATSSGGERGSHGPFPRPICGAVLVAKDGRVSSMLVVRNIDCACVWGR